MVCVFSLLSNKKRFAQNMRRTFVFVAVLVGVAVAKEAEVVEVARNLRHAPLYNEAQEEARRRGADVVLVDTASRRVAVGWAEAHHVNVACAKRVVARIMDKRHDARDVAARARAKLVPHTEEVRTKCARALPPTENKFTEDGAKPDSKERARGVVHEQQKRNVQQHCPEMHYVTLWSLMTPHLWFAFFVVIGICCGPHKPADTYGRPMGAPAAPAVHRTVSSDDDDDWDDWDIDDDSDDSDSD